MRLYDGRGKVFGASDRSTDVYNGYGGQIGYYTDGETGLVLCTFRYYDPQVGRWLTRDPAGYAGGMNLYAYCYGNPTNSLDPLGLCGDAHDKGSNDIDRSWIGNLGRAIRRLLGADKGSGSAPTLGNSGKGNAGTVRDMTSGGDDSPDAFMFEDIRRRNGIGGKMGNGVGVVGDEILGGMAVAAVTDGAGKGLGAVVDGVGGAAGGALRIPGKKFFLGKDGPARAFEHLSKNHGVPPHTASNRLHLLKQRGGVPADGDVIIGRTGDVYNSLNGEHLGMLTDKALGH